MSSQPHILDHAQPLLDTLARPLSNLRLSVTDRCNLRCKYCMPEQHYTWLERKELLTFEELTLLTKEFMDLGVRQVRLTGGEPLLRRNLPKLVSALAALPKRPQLAMTTNGIHLPSQALALRHAGLNRITISLDTLDETRFHSLTGRMDFKACVDGIEKAAEAEFDSLKLNMVVIRGVNDDEVNAMLKFGHQQGAEVRFIEYMDVGGANRWSPNAVVSAPQILEKIGQLHGSIKALGRPQASSPATRYQLSDGTTFGVISSTTQPFCSNCDRSRVTADGKWFTCLYAQEGIDLREALRSENLSLVRAVLRNTWKTRHDKGAQERLSVPQRGPLVPLSTLRRKPHLEMHTRGG